MRLCVSSSIDFQNLLAEISYEYALYVGEFCKIWDFEKFESATKRETLVRFQERILYFIYMAGRDDLVGTFLLHVGLLLGNVSYERVHVDRVCYRQIWL